MGIYEEVLEQIKEAVATTLMVVAPELQEHASHIIGQRNGFELLGYDVLIDENRKAHILEINRSPSMTAHSENKRARKASLLGDVFCIVGLGCERASVRPGTILDDEADMLGVGDERLNSQQCLEREAKRAT